MTILVLIEKTFSMVTDRSSINVTILSSIDGNFLSNVLFMVVWKINKLIISLFSLLVTYATNFVVTTVGSLQIMRSLLFANAPCDYVAPV